MDARTVGEEGADRVGRLVEHRTATKPPNDAAPTQSRSKPPLADSTNAGGSGAVDEGRGARGGGTVEMPEADAVEMPKAIRFAIRAGRRKGDDDGYEYDDDDGGERVRRGFGRDAARGGVGFERRCGLWRATAAATSRCRTPSSRVALGK